MWTRSAGSVRLSNKTRSLLTLTNVHQQNIFLMGHMLLRQRRADLQDQSKAARALQRLQQNWLCACASASELVKVLTLCTEIEVQIHVVKTVCDRSRRTDRTALMN